MRTPFSLTVTAVWFLSGALAQPLPQGVTKGGAVEGIEEFTLANGMRVLLFPDPSKPKVTVNVTYLVGSKHENYGETGMAHLLEHLLFKGTEKNPLIMKQLQDRGADFNGTTWYDRTNYFETLTATPENLRWALEMEADRMVNSRVAKSDLDTEMTVVRNEFEMGENSPFGVLMQRVIAVSFDWHNYGKETIGARSDIENVPIERLQAFYRRYYQPDNAMLVVAGKFDQAQALRDIAATFGAIPRPARKLEPAYTREPVQDGERTVNVKRVGDTQLIMTAFHIPAGTHEDYAAIEVLGRVLADNPTGRLYKALVDNKKAASIMGFEFQLAEPGIWLMGAQLRKEQSMEEARKTLLETIAGVAGEPPTKEEVERAKTKLLKQIELNLANSERVGVELSEWASMADWRMMFIHRDRIAKVSPDDVIRVAKAYLKEDNRSVGMFIPTEKPDRSEIPAAPDVTALVKDYKGGKAVAAGEAFDPSPENIQSRLKNSQLANGMKLVLLSKKNRGETVSAQILLRSGTEGSLMNRGAEASAAWSMLMRGTTKHNRQQLQDEFDRLKARVNVGGGAELGTASIETVRANLPEVLALVREVLREPAFPESEFEQIRQAALAGIEARRRDPQFIAMNELTRHMNPYPKGDVRATNTPDESKAEWEAVTLDKAKDFYRRFVGGSSESILTVAGDFDAAEITKLAGDLFGDWKAASPVRRVPRKFQAVAPLAKTIETPDKANAMFYAGVNIEISDEHPDAPALRMANQLFGGGTSSRLFRRLREKEGWSYGAGSGLTVPAKDTAGGLRAYAILAPQNMEKLEAGFREEVAKALEDGFTADELEKAKTAWANEQVIDRSQDRRLLGLLTSNAYWGRTMAFQAEQEKKIAALTLDQVNAVLRKYLKPDAISVVRAGDFSKKP